MRRICSTSRTQIESLAREFYPILTFNGMKNTEVNVFSSILIRSVTKKWPLRFGAIIRYVITRSLVSLVSA